MTAEDDSALREVERQIAADRQDEIVKKYTPLFVAAGLAVVAGVGGWQAWKSQAQKRAEAAAIEYRAILKTAAEKPEDGRAALAKFAETAPSGYKALAEMRRAADLAGAGNRDEALALYRKVAAETKSGKRLRDLARLRAAQLAFPDGRDAVKADLGPLIEDKAALGFYARELLAFADFDSGDYEAAEQAFRTAAADAEAPNPVKVRAEGLAPLAAAAKSGVKVKADVTTTDIVKSLGIDTQGVLDQKPGEAAPGAIPAANSPAANSPADLSAPRKNE